LRTLHTVPAISVAASGPSYSVVRLCETLTDRGNETELAALDWEPMRSAPCFAKFFPLGLGPRNLGLSGDMKRWIYDRARDHDFELFHSHSLWMMPNIYPGRAARRYSVPYVVSPRGTLSPWAFRSGSVVKKLFWPLVQRPALNAVTCFHATADSEYCDLRAMGFRQPVAVIQNGIDIPYLQERARSSRRTLLFLGRIHPVKGVDVLLLAWEAVQVRFPEWNLRIVGPDNGGYLLQMRELADKLRLSRVSFDGPLVGSDKWIAYRDAQLYVLPTHSENFGLSVAEALASGTPAIVSRGAPWGGLDGKRAGWWIEVGVDPLVACLTTALSLSETQLDTMGANGRSWMAEDFSWDTVSARMERTYDWIVRGGTKPTWVRDT
jgi:glycosyltransferase involved in cell wall biosynthesis